MEPIIDDSKYEYKRMKLRQLTTRTRSDNVPATLVVHKDKQAEWNGRKPPRRPRKQTNKQIECKETKIIQNQSRKLWSGDNCIRTGTTLAFTKDSSSEDMICVYLQQWVHAQSRGQPGSVTQHDSQESLEYQAKVESLVPEKN